MKMSWEVVGDSLEVALDKKFKSSRKNLADGINAVTTMALTRMKIHAPRSTGGMVNNLHATVATESNPVSEIIAGKDYTRMVDEGTGPHKTSNKHDEFVASLKAWVKQKGLPDEAFYPIYMRIVKEGTPAHPFIDEAVEQAITDGPGIIMKYLMR